MTVRLLTGFPGFLGSALAERLLDRAPDAAVVCLVQPHYAALARSRAEALTAADPARAGRIRLVEGDITHPDLGLGDALPDIRRSVHEVYHLAAAYDLGISRAVGERVNVDGTRHVLGVCGAAPRLERLHYVSTCYVSGRHAGRFGEDDLDVGQTFYNHYEATKFRAEVAVRSAMEDGLPATVYRPSIVVGDSRTGVTQKLDGPYTALGWMLRWRRTVPLPLPGDPHRHRVNLVPRDWVVAALDALSARSDTGGRVYHLCDPAAPTVAEAISLFAAAADRAVLRVPIPLPLLQCLLRLPGVAAWSGLTPETVPYFAHPARYTTERTTPALAEAGLPVPPLSTYAHRLLAFARDNPHLARAGMR